MQVLSRVALLATFVIACGSPKQADPVSPASSASATASATPSHADAKPATSSEAAPAASETAQPAQAAQATDPQAALASAKKDGKATLIVFCAKWVAACGELSNTLADGDVQKTLGERFVVARVDATSEDDATTKERMKRYNVKGLPSMIVFDRKGKEVGRESGHVDANKLARLLERAK